MSGPEPPAADPDTFTEAARAALSAQGLPVSVVRSLVLRVGSAGAASGAASGEREAVIQLASLWMARRAGALEAPLLERLCRMVLARLGDRGAEPALPDRRRLVPLLRRADQRDTLFQALGPAERPPVWPLPGELWWTLALDQGDQLALARRVDLDRLGLRDEPARALALQNLDRQALSLEPVHGPWWRLRGEGGRDAALLLRPDRWPLPAARFAVVPAQDLLLLSAAPLAESALALRELQAEWEGRLSHPLSFTALAVGEGTALCPTASCPTACPPG